MSARQQLNKCFHASLLINYFSQNAMKSQKKISNKLIFQTFIFISHKTRDPNHPIKVKDTTKLSNKSYCYKNITYGIY